MSAKSGTRSLRAGLLNAATFSLTSIGLAVGLASVNSAAALVTQETLTPAAAVDTANSRPMWVGIGIRNEAGNSGGTCTGLLINPRTVLFAAHCVDGLAPAAYDGNSPGNRAQVAYTMDPTFGNANLRQWLFAQDYGNQVGWDGRTMYANSVNVFYHPASRNGPDNGANDGTFLPADIAIAAFDTANGILGRDAVNGIGLLFSPVTGEIAVQIGGFGQSGNALTGARQSDFQRRLGSNILSFLGNERDISLGVYPVGLADQFNPSTYTYQDLYWLDFDDPLRASRPLDAANGTNPFDFDVFEGDAVAGEAITAAGDSGSPLVTTAFGRAVSLGVLSQGSRFFFDVTDYDDNYAWFQTFSNYGTASGYNPLFLYWDFIVANNPYKYVGAVAGDGEWTDSAHWVQELDPLYYTLSGTTLVNGVPTTPGLGVSDATPNFGTVNPNPYPPQDCWYEGTCVTANSGEIPAGGTSVAMPGEVTLAGDVSGTTTGGGAVMGTAADANANQANGQMQTAGDATGNEAQAGVSGSTGIWPLYPSYNTGALTGPGTTGFVPNNTNGTAGVINSTRFFEVNLRNAGTTYLTAASVVIDRLNVRGANSGLNIRSGASLTTNLVSYLDTGAFTVNGSFIAPQLGQSGGYLTGTGTITTTMGLLVAGGIVSGGSLNAGVGTLNVVGGASFTLGALYGVDVASAISNDRLAITGGLNIGSGVGYAANFLYTPTFGTTWTVATTTTGVTGAFSSIASNLPGVLRAQVNTVGNNLVMSIIALPFASAGSYESPEQIEVATTLDQIRGMSGGYTALSSLFNSLDQTPTALLDDMMESLTPLNAFVSQGLTQGMTGLVAGAITKRSDQLSDGLGHGFDASGASAMLNANVLQAAADPFDAMMMGATAVVAAQDAAAETAAKAASIKLREGWGGFFDISTLLSSGYEATPFIGEADLTGTTGTLGFDYGFSDGAFAGFSFSYGTSDADISVPVQSAEADSWGVNVYGGVHEGDSFLNGYLGYSGQTYDLERVVPLMLGTQTLIATPDGETWSAGAKMGFDLTSESGTFTPYASIDGKWISIDSYTETGGSAAMSFDSVDTALIDARIGLEYAGTFETGDGVLRPKLGLAWVIDVQSDDNVLNTAFAAFPAAPLTFVGSERDGGWVEYAAGLEYETSAFGLALSYTGGDNGVLSYNQLSGRVSFAW